MMCAVGKLDPLVGLSFVLEVAGILPENLVLVFRIVTGSLLTYFVWVLRSVAGILLTVVLSLIFIPMCSTSFRHAVVGSRVAKVRTVGHDSQVVQKIRRAASIDMVNFATFRYLAKVGFHHKSMTKVWLPAYTDV